MSTTIINGQSAAWWKTAVVYQIYPHSFCDSNGDGIGDLRGIITKVPYLQELGVTVVWLSPIYKSPQNDMGYDVADYRAINPDYGTMEDWHELKRELDKAGIRLLMDLVVNHTSDQHEWFLESRKCPQNAKRSWYHWQPPRFDGQGLRHPPNNWRSFFGNESAWEYDETTEEYYLRLFTREQPDLNWENPEVRKEIQNIMAFWLAKGIDGFRVDAINYVCKAPGYPDTEIVEPESFHQPAMHLYLNRDKVHEYLRELNENALSQYDVMTVGETPHVDDMETALKYVHPSRKEFSMVFTWEHMDVDRQPNTVIGWRPWDLSQLKDVLGKWQVAMIENGGWNALYLENHDQGRSIPRFGCDEPEYRWLSGKLLALLLATLSGTLYLHQGQEIGMINLPRSWSFDEYSDVVSRMHLSQEKRARINATGNPNPDMEDVLKDLQLRARDHGRTPMQWDRSSNAGFTSGAAWRKVNPDHENCNVEAAMDDHDSLFHFWRTLLLLRANWPTLVYGNFEMLAPDDKDVFAYMRRCPSHGDALVLLNFCSKQTKFSLPIDLSKDASTFILGNYAASDLEQNVLLNPWEARLYRLD